MLEKIQHILPPGTLKTRSIYTTETKTIKKGGLNMGMHKGTCDVCGKQSDTICIQSHPAIMPISIGMCSKACFDDAYREGIKFKAFGRFYGPKYPKMTNDEIAKLGNKYKHNGFITNMIKNILLRRAREAAKNDCRK